VATKRPWLSMETMRETPVSLLIWMLAPGALDASPKMLPVVDWATTRELASAELAAKAVAKRLRVMEGFFKAALSFCELMPARFLARHGEGSPCRRAFRFNQRIIWWDSESRHPCVPRCVAHIDANGRPYGYVHYSENAALA